MRIKQIVSQHRRDFTAVFECEHCGAQYPQAGYDDRNFHETVVPALLCRYCGRKAPETYRALSPEYPDSEVV